MTTLTQLKRVSPPVRLSIPPIPHIFRTLKSFADLRHTTHDLQPYSISRETRSEHWVATPTLPAPVPKNQVLRRIGIPTTFTRHSELFDNFLLLPKYTKQQFLSSCHCDRATRTPTLPYSPITRTSTQTSLLVLPRFVTVTS